MDTNSQLSTEGIRPGLVRGTGAGHVQVKFGSVAFGSTSIASLCARVLQGQPQAMDRGIDEPISRKQLGEQMKIDAAVTGVGKVACAGQDGIGADYVLHAKNVFI